MRPGWLAHPVQSTLIGATWLLLQQSVAPANLITACVLALMLPRLLHGFTGAPRRPRAWGTALRLTLVVLRDIVVSNISVAKLALLPSARPEPVWVPIEMRLRDPRAITLLATIITTTPGTVSCVIDETRHHLLVHALDGSAGAEAIAADIRERYETPLMEIFE